MFMIINAEASAYWCSTLYFEYGIGWGREATVFHTAEQGQEYLVNAMEDSSRQPGRISIVEILSIKDV